MKRRAATRLARAAWAAGLVWCALLAAGSAGASGAAGADTVVANSDELGTALRQACPAVRLQALPAVQGCGPAGCGTQLGGLFVDADAGRLRRSNGRLLPLITAGPVPAADLPELNWTPLRAYTVQLGRHNWGQCLEFSHAGLGSSGRAQRWRTVLLVAAAGRSAQRVTGYQIGCAALCAGPAATEVQLPAVQPVVAGLPALHIVWHRCSAKGCAIHNDARTVEGRADSDSGALTLRP